MRAVPFRRLSFDSDRNVIREAWDRLEGKPLGRRVFSRLIGIMVPYSGSMGAEVRSLERGRATIALRDRHAVRNHLRSVHAVALVNLAELTGNLALVYALPDDARFIVKRLSIEYLKKARGTIVATGTCSPDETSERHDVDIDVELRDDAGDLVARCTLHSLVGPKPRD